MLRRVGDLTAAELDLRVRGVAADDGAGWPSCWPRSGPSRSSWPARRGTPPPTTRPATATRSAARCRSGLPAAFTEPVPRPLEDLVGRYARTHGPFTEREVADRFGVPESRGSPARSRRWRPTAASCAASSVPRACGGSGATATCCASCGGARWPRCGARSSRSSRRRWPGSCRRGTASRRSGGASTPSSRRSACSPARRSWRPRSSPTCWPRASPTTAPALLDELCTSGDVVWVGAGAIGSSDGRVRVCFADQLPLLAPGWEVQDRARGRRARRHAARCSPSGAPASGTSCGRPRRAPPTTSCSPRCGTSCGPARSPTTRWRRCGRSPASGRVARRAPATSGRGPAATRSPQPRRAAGRRRAAGAWSRRCSSRCRRRPRRRTPRRCSSSSATASSPARPCWPRASSAGTPRCTAC